jgi:two-component system response regulator RegX3
VSSPTRPIPAASSPTVTESARVLVVEDEESLAESVRYNLEREGYDVTVATDGRRALERFRTDAPALVILDLMLPEMSGLDLCRMIRAESDVPIIMVTAKDSEADKVTGLELGADDYVTKPFSMRELVSRVRANLRRTRPQAGTEPGDEVLSGGPVRMDVGRHEVAVRGSTVALPPKEFELLEAFLRRRGRLLTREFLIDEVWGSDYFGDTRTLDVHVKRLRRKLEDDPHHPRHLLTVRGLGYKFVD